MFRYLSKFNPYIFPITKVGTSIKGSKNKSMGAYLDLEEDFMKGRGNGFNKNVLRVP